MLVELLVMILIYFDLLLDLFLSSVCLTMWRLYVSFCIWIRDLVYLAHCAQTTI
jgi:hypothetical protein